MAIQDSAQKVLGSSPESFENMPGINFGQEQDYSQEQDFEKYGGVANGIQTFGRALLNTGTLGIYGAVTDRYRSKEEKEEIKKRDLFHPGSEFAGSAAAYLLPVIGESAALSAVTTVPRLGEMVAQTAFKGEAATSAHMITQNAIDGAAMAASAGVGRASLDDFSQESVSAAATETALGFLGGGLLGGTLSAINPLTKSMKAIFAGKPGTPGEFTGPARVNEQAQLNRSNFSQVYREVQPLFNKPFDQMTDDQIKDAVFYGGYFSKLAKNEDASNKFFDHGTEDWMTHLDKAKKLDAIHRQYGEGRPAMPLATESGDALNNIISQGQNIRIKTAMAEPGVFTSARLNQEISPERAWDLTTELTRGDTSVLEVAEKQFDEMMNPELATARKVKEYQATHGRDPDPSRISSIQDPLTYNVRSEFIKGLRSAIANAEKETGVGSIRLSSEAAANPEHAALVKMLEKQFAQAEKQFPQAQRAAAKEEFFRLNGVELKPSNPYAKVEAVSPSKTYDFLDKVVSGMNKVYYATSKKTAQERAFFSDFKTRFQKPMQDPSKFGEMAARHATLRDAREEINQALTKLHKSIGVKHPYQEGKATDIIPINTFKKTIAYNKSTGQMSLRDYMPAAEELMEAYEKNLPIIGQQMGMNFDKEFGTMAMDYARFKGKWDQLRLLTDSTMQKWYREPTAQLEAMEKIGINGIGQSPLTRLIRAGEDFISGQGRYGRIQLVRLGIETMLRSVKMTSPVTNTAEFLASRTRALYEAQKVAQGTQKQISSMAMDFVKGVSPVGMAAKVLPYAMISGYRAQSVDINKRFDEVVAHLDKIRENPVNVVSLESHYEPLKHLTANGNNFTSEKVLGTLGQLMQAIPPGPSLLEGGGKPSTIEQAKFLDVVTALANPSRMFELIASNSATSEQIQAFSQAWPQYWNKFREQLTLQLLNNRDINPVDRTKIMSLSGIQTIAMPLPGMGMGPGTGPGSLPGAQTDMGKTETGERLRQIPGTKTKSRAELMKPLTQLGGA